MEANQGLDDTHTPKLKDSSKKYIYRFDNPLLKESGFIQLSNKLIILHFPERIGIDYCKENATINTQLYVNRQLRFHSSWLPIVTPSDVLKCKDMINRCYSEYTALTTKKTGTVNYYESYVYNELITVHNKENFALSCFEDKFTTSIELDITSPNNSQDAKHIQVQIFIGPYLTFCSNQYLQNLDSVSVQFILSFILSKLANF